MPGLEIDQRRAPRRGCKMRCYYITAGSWLQLLLMCCCTFIALFPVFIVARFIPAAQETQHMLNLESSQRLAAMNNMEHHVKSNMIISAGAASKDNDQDEAVQKRVYPQHRQAAAAAAVAGLPHDVNLHHMRRLSTLKAHAPASSSGDEEEEILMERILFNFDHSDYVDPGANTDPGVPSLPSGSSPGPPHKQ
ncbi:hypothetical protein BDL97_03G098000 [Sphagnum fallax]|nr:hypothetical protein BDL97_03G098000 [Sphagnum fallax]